MYGFRHVVEIYIRKFKAQPFRYIPPSLSLIQMEGPDLVQVTKKNKFNFRILKTWFFNFLLYIVQEKHAHGLLTVWIHRKMQNSLTHPAVAR